MAHAVVPADADDPGAPSGGNVYDRRVLRGLRGWTVREVAAEGAWPRPDETDRAALDRSLRSLPDGAATVLDGLVACGVPEVVVPHARRLRTVVLLHMPLADETGVPAESAAALEARERDVLRAASAVVTTSRWAARNALARHDLAESRLHVVEPGTDPAPLARGGDGASRLLCVAAVTPRKGQAVLVEALAAVADLPWTCVCAGPVTRDPGYVDAVRELVARRGLDDRVRLVGPRSGPELAALYAEADLTVLPSRGETYGMVLTESLARGVPVLATDAGAVPETLGEGPGLLVPPGDPEAFASALRRWLTDGDLRRGLKGSAVQRRGSLRSWADASRELRGVLEQVMS